MEHLQKIVKSLQEKLDNASVDDYEIYACADEGLEVEAKNQKVEFFSRAQEEGVAVRVTKNSQVGMSSMSSITLDATDQLIKDAIAAMESSASMDGVIIPRPNEGVATLTERPGQTLSEIPDREKIAFAKKVEKATLDSHPLVVRARQPRYREVTRRAIAMNSRGVLEQAQRSLVFCEVQAVAEKEGSSESAAEMGHHIRFEDLDGEELGRRAGLRAASILGANAIPTGRYPVYLEPRAAAALLRVLIPSFFADNVQRNKSRLRGKLGEEIFSSHLTIMDHGLLQSGAGSFLFDGEGVARQRTTLVNGGQIKGWLYDGASAMRDETASTGNAERRSIHDSPHIAITNCYINEGPKSAQDLISWCDGGLWVSDLMGVHTANIVTGDFSLGAVGYKIEGGSMGAPVRGVVLAGNVFDLFHRLAGVSSDLKFFGKLGAPSIAIDGFQVDGT
jgi:PmbA protein